MLDVTALYTGRMSAATAHRYGCKNKANSDKLNALSRPKSAAARRPVVVWNATRACNLKCVHCYSDSAQRSYPGELSTAEAKKFLRDLAKFKIPALLISGGEPLMRKDIFELARFAGQKGLRMTLSTNGTLISREMARRIADAGFSYVGVSLDGTEKTHDKFRGQKGAFRRAVNGIRNLKAAGQKVGLRMTLTRQNIGNLPEIFRLVEKEGLDRACFYHLAPAGRGYELAAPTRAQNRAAVNRIFDWVLALDRRGKNVEVLTVDNHCDGPFLYLRMLKDKNRRAASAYKMLDWNGGGLNSSGLGIACVDSAGEVHPDQFWLDYSAGNVRRRPFSKIWTLTTDPLLNALRDRGGRRGKITGRCATPLRGFKRTEPPGRCAKCRFFNLCGGGLRIRAGRLTGDIWASDPACYLADGEIG